MNKEEILKRSREQKEDEGTVFAENKGRRYGIIMFSAVFIIITLFNLFAGQNNFAPYSMFFAYIAAEAYGRYRVELEKKLLVSAVFGAIASILFLICYILDTLGVAA